MTGAHTRISLLAAVAASATAAACSSGGSGGGGGGGNTAVSGIVLDFSTAGPISGATVALQGGGPSTQTASDGSWTLMLASNQTAFLTATKSSYITSEIGVAVNPGGVAGTELDMVSNLDANAVQGLLGITIDPSKGALSLFFNSPVPGYGATLSAAFTNSSFTFNGQAPQFSSVTLASNQVLVFTNVAVGSTTVTANPPGGHTCANSQPTIINWRVDPNTIDGVIFTCN